MQAIFVSRRHLKHLPAYHQQITSAKWVSHEPVGVVLQFAPWTWPILYTLIKLIPALVSGNSVVLKHSYLTPQVGYAIEQIVAELGIPDLVRHVEVDRDMFRPLVTHKKVGFLSFIGEYGTGMKIYEDACFDSLNDVSLRFTGKDAAVLIIF
jgi:acyl-CoA reductase-like NAD-dependent aldehyde dehydrogenase